MSNRLLHKGLCLSCLLAATTFAGAADIAWINPQGGNWGDARNWSGGQLPGPADRAVISLAGSYRVTANVTATVAGILLGGAGGAQTLQIGGGTLTVDGASQIEPSGVLELASGTLTGGGDMMVLGKIQWTGGTWRGAGVATIPKGVTLDISGSAAKFFYERTLVVGGEIVWTGAGDFYTGNGAKLTLQPGALFDIQNNSILRHWTGAALAFSNGGTIRKAGGTATSTIQPPLNSSGLIEIQTGTLALSGGGSIGGTLSAADAATTQFTGGTVTIEAGAQLPRGGAYEIAGATVRVLTSAEFNSLSVSGGSFEPTTACRVTSLGLSSGFVRGSGRLVVERDMRWTGGTIQNSGVLEIAKAAAVEISGAGSKTLYECAVELFGTMTWTGTGDLFTGNGAKLTIQNGAVFDIRNDSDLRHWAGTALAFANEGVIRKGGGSGTTTIQMALASAGSIEVQTGKLAFTGGGSVRGVFNCAADATAQFSGGTMTFETGAQVARSGTFQVSNGTVRVAASAQFVSLNISGGTFAADGTCGAETMNLSGGVLTGAGALSVEKLLQWTGGRIEGSGGLAILRGAALRVDGTASKTLYERSVEIGGMLIWSGTGDLFTGNAAKLAVQQGGLFDIRNDAMLRQWSGTPMSFSNAGSIQKSGGTGVTTIQMPLANTGSILVQTGALAFGNGGSIGGILDCAPGASVVFAGGTAVVESSAQVAARRGAYQVTSGTARFAAAADLISLLVSGGTFVADGQSRIESAVLSGGAIAGTGAIIIEQRMEWTGGAIQGDGRLSIAKGATLQIEGNGSKTLYERLIEIAGLMNWTGTGDLYTGNGAKLTVLAGGVFEIANDAILRQWAGTPLTFINQGTLRKGAGSGTSTVQMALNNQGTLSIAAGSMQLNGGGANSGIVDTADGRTLSFSGGTFEVLEGARFSGPGLHRLNGATLSIEGPTRIDLLEFSSGNLTGKSSLTVGKRIDWTGGSMLGPGTTVIPSAALLAVSGSASKTLYERLLEIGGRMTWADGGDLYTGNAAKLTVQAGGVFEIQNDRLLRHWAGTPIAFVNEGTIEKTAGPGAATIQMALINRGLLRPVSGTITLNGGGASAGIIDVPRENAVAFSGGVFTLEKGAQFPGPGVHRLSNGTLDVAGEVAISLIEMSGGTLAGTGLLQATSRFHWTGGTMQDDGKTAIAKGAVMLVSGTSSKTLYSRTLEIAGSMAWTDSGELYTGNAGALRILDGGLFDIQNDRLFRHWTGTPITFSNAGTLRKSTGSGTSTIQVAVVNTSLVEVSSGTLLLNAGGSNAGVMDAADGAVLQWNAGTFTLAAGTRLPGQGIYRLSGGTLEGATDLTIPVFDFTGGTFTGDRTLTLGSGSSWSSGTMQGAGRTLVPASANVAIDGSGSKTLYERLFEVAGTVVWSAGGDVYTGNAARFEILPTGALEIQSNQTFRHWAGAMLTLVNRGVIRKSGAPGTTTIQVPVVSSGLIDLQSGTAALTRELTLEPGSVLRFVLSGPAAGTEHARATVAGAARLAGVLEAVLAAGFKPAVGSRLTVLTHGAAPVGSSPARFERVRPSQGWVVEPSYAARDLSLVTLGVDAVNTAPTISAIPDQTLFAGSTVAVPFTIADQESQTANLFVDVAAANAELFGLAQLRLEGTGGQRTLWLTGPLARSGSSRISVTVSDGVNIVSSAFTATVQAGNVPGCAPQPPGLIGWWRGEHNALDSTGAHNGDLAGGVSYAKGKAGSAFQFDGVDGRVVLGGWNPGNRWTIEAWANLSSIPTGRRTVAGGVTQCADWALGIHDGKWGAIIRPANGACTLTIVGPDVAEAGRWYHLAATCDGTTARIYVDGELKGSGPVVPDYIGTSLNVLIGGEICCSGGYFPGLIDEVAIYNRALSLEEIRSIWQAGDAAKCLGRTLTTDRIAVGNALGFDGKDDYVAIADAASLQGASVTLEGWFNFTSAAGLQALITKTVGKGINNSYALWLDASRLLGSIGSAAEQSSFVTTPFAPEPGRWYHLAFSYNAQNGEQALYIDGIRRAANTTPVKPGYDAHPVILGASIENEALALWFSGKMDEVRIWNLSRTEAQIAAAMNRALVGGETGLAAYYRFEERIGAAVLDSTSFRNHGQLGGGNAANQPAVVGSTVGSGNSIVTKENKQIVIQLASGLAQLPPIATITGLPKIGQLFQTSDGISRGAAIRSVPATVTDPLLRVLYVPPFDAVGDDLDSFAFTLSDGISTSPEGIIRVSVQGIVPLIGVQPLSQTVKAGADVVFRVEAKGSRPISFQWLFDGNPIPGATDAVLRLAAVGAAQSGLYSVRVSNPAGSVASETAALRVLVPPRILTHPAPQNINIGGSATLSVVVEGTGPFTYQWRRNGFNIRGANAPNLPITNFQIGDAGLYSVIVASANGAIISDNAPVLVELPRLDLRDSFAQRLRFTDAVLSGRGNNRGATREPGEPIHAGKRGGSSVWISWVAPASGDAGFTTAGSEVDTLLAVYTGNTLAGLVPVVSDDDSAGFFASAVRFNAIQGTEYQIAIDGLAGDVGEIILSWALVPSLDRLPEIVRLPQSRVAVEGETVVFEIAATDPSPIAVPLAFQWFFNDAPINGATAARLTLANVTAAQVGAYTVRVSTRAFAVTTPPVTLQITSRADVAADQAVLSDDKFADAVPPAAGAPVQLASFSPRPIGPAGGLASGYTGTQVFSTAGSGTESGEPNHCGVIGGASQWFSYRAESSGNLVIATDGSDFNTVLAVYTGPGTDFASLVQIACDDNGGADGQDSRVQINAVAGTVYYIAVDGVAGAFGNVNLSYSLVVPMQWSQIAGPPAPLRFRLQGQPGALHTIERSVDLLNWISVMSTNSPTGIIEFNEEGASAGERRFYRAVRLN